MRNRFTMEMSDGVAQTLERVQGAIGAANKSDVFREALAILLTLVEAAEAGNFLWIGRSSNSLQRVLVPSLENAARAARARQHRKHFKLPGHELVDGGCARCPSYGDYPAACQCGGTIHVDGGEAFLNSTDEPPLTRGPQCDTCGRGDRRRAIESDPEVGSNRDP